VGGPAAPRSPQYTYARLESGLDFRSGGRGLEGEDALVCDRFRSLSLVSITPADTVR